MNSFGSKVVVFFIKGYQKTLSPDTGFLRHFFPTKTAGTCMYYPSCSEYMILAVQKHGLAKGLFMGVRRILSCRPGKEPAVDFP